MIEIVVPHGHTILRCNAQATIRRTAVGCFGFDVANGDQRWVGVLREVRERIVLLDRGDECLAEVREEEEVVVGGVYIESRAVEELLEREQRAFERIRAEDGRNLDSSFRRLVGNDLTVHEGSVEKPVGTAQAHCWEWIAVQQRQGGRHVDVRLNHCRLETAFVVAPHRLREIRAKVMRDLRQWRFPPTTRLHDRRPDESLCARKTRNGENIYRPSRLPVQKNLPKISAKRGNIVFDPLQTEQDILNALIARDAGVRHREEP